MPVPVWKKTLAVAALAAALGTPTMAQTNNQSWWSQMSNMMGGWGPGGGPMMGRWGRGPMMGWNTEGMLDRIDGRLAFMKAELKITDGQKAAWDELAEAVRSTAQTHNDMMRSMMKDVQSGEFFKQSLPDRLISRETRLEARLEEVRTVKAAVDKLYGLLSDKQKEVADEIVLPTMGMGMGRMRGIGPGRMRN